MALQPISSLGIAGPLSGTAQPDNFGAPANWVPGNGPPPGMTWSETQGRWMPSDSVVGAMPGPVASPIDNTLPVKFGTEPPNSNPYGFTAPTGPSTQALVPYYNKVTGQTWNAPSGGYTPPSADWFQGSPNPQISPGGVMPMPGFAPGMDPITPYMPIMGGNPVPMPQQPAPTPNIGGLGSLLTPQQPVQTPMVNRPPQNVGGLNSLTGPQTPINTGFFGSTQPFVRNQFAPRAGSLPSLRIRPTFKRSLPVPFAKPPFRR